MGDEIPYNELDVMEKKIRKFKNKLLYKLK